MDITIYDLYTMQLLHYLITQYDYTIVKVQQHNEDIWLMNARSQDYPVLRICNKENACTLSDTDYIRNVHRLILNLIHREGPVMILNVHPDSAPIENPLLTQIRITKDQVSNPSILKTFPGIDHIIHDVENVQDEYAKLSKEIEEAQLIQQKESLAKAKKAARPKATVILMVISVIWMGITYIMSILCKDALMGVLVSGGYYKLNVVAAHEFYRLFTAGFVHGDVFQLMVNLFVLYSVGKVCERMYQKKQYVWIFLVSIVIGNIFVYISAGNTISYGMSAGIVGLIAAYLTALFSNGSWRIPLVRFSMIKIIWFGLLMLIVSGVPMIGCMGGAVCGLFMGILFSRGRKYMFLKNNIRLSGAFLLVALAFMMSQVSTVQPIHKDVDTQLIEVYRHTPLDGYANYLQRCFEKQYAKEELS
ncbi:MULTISPECIES: rhomboid family intramembrane serine protease [Bacillota]|mgnify:CR=1 FL=1|jgi:rhomboid protease GluP|uniref:Rhomboid family intramembrane serine protease n=2 Tax=Amedibacillus TaxID=2749846 RepID=A0A7G9GLG8_9FIRM|nr:MULTISPECIES: rhomboid family intramembrane serine protease [Bacillota]QNM11650.1 rhomboid family intramembrane serine protease [[Eubacterium] hominis]MCH4285102.1 rhomboid family intramembrane serine protease [Amedibacillus hominis]RGB56131.1 rhomboid family intramembrane serine protease [Absiella sp. AM22-9]RGB61892.1 rhomboid family intramembrane serine protease [Absiella sp. AM10-20]RGB70285.1 rhomboid family intramembrane serine protease [Absiella sp. AM09-45]